MQMWIKTVGTFAIGFSPKSESFVDLNVVFFSLSVLF